MSRDQIVGVTPNPTYPCCRCCGTYDPDWAELAYVMAHCTARDRHADPCIMCGQRGPK